MSIERGLLERLSLQVSPWGCKNGGCLLVQCAYGGVVYIM